VHTTLSVDMTAASFSSVLLLVLLLVLILWYGFPDCESMLNVRDDARLIPSCAARRDR